MSKRKWIRAKRPEFVRDVLRDFCLAARDLERCFQRFDETGAVAFDPLLDLLGDEMLKGLLWRLKDTSHHLFRNEPGEELVGRFLDWAIGYIFHESVKLKEDAYQQEHYAPRLRDMAARGLDSVEACYCAELLQVPDQTSESISREIKRIRFILRQCQGMFPLYLAHYRENVLLARFLFEQTALVCEAFGENYQNLIRGVYGDHPETLYVLAARSLREGGWTDKAERAVNKALDINPGCAAARRERALLDSNSATAVA